MSQTSVQPPSDTEQADAGIGMTSVLVMLVVLAALVIGIYWGLPMWFGGSVIDVTIRN